MKVGISRIDLSSLNVHHCVSDGTLPNMSAVDQLIAKEARSLYLAASLLGDTIAEKREALEQIVDTALKYLNANQK